VRWQFEIHDGAAGGTRFLLRMSNGKEALSSAEWPRLEACLDTIMIVRARSAVRRAFVPARSPEGKHAVSLVSGRDDILATSPWFASRAAQTAAVLAIRALAPTAPLVDCRRSAAAGGEIVRSSSDENVGPLLTDDR